MAYTYTWNSAFQTVPADTEDISRGAERIRDLKRALQERLDAEHYWDPSGTDADHGEHRHVTLRQQSSAPTHAADKGILYTKEAGGKAELFFVDEDGNEVQITSGGSIDVTVADPIPSGSKMWFYQNTAPTGWTYLSAITDRCLAVKGGSNAYNVNGGTEAGSWTQPSHTLTTAQIPAHTHSVSVYTQSANGARVRSSAGPTLGGTAYTGSAGSGSAHNHGTTYRPYAAVGIICEKD